MKHRTNNIEDRLAQQLRQDCLLHGNPRESLGANAMLGRLEMCHNETLGSTLTETADFIAHCYDFSLNPLAHLRRYYPKFQWKFVSINSGQELAPTIVTFDYVWPKNYLGWELFGIVGAVAVSSNRQGPRKRICFCPSVPSVNGFVPDINFWPIETLRAKGIRVFATNENIHDGVFL